MMTGRKTRHIPLNKIDVIKYKIVDLIEQSQRISSFLSHFILIIWKIYKFRNYQFISSYIGYYVSFVFIFINYMFFLSQEHNDLFANDLLELYKIKLGPSVDLKEFKFVIDHPNSKDNKFFNKFTKHFEQICEFDEVIYRNETIENEYDKLKLEFGEKLLGRLIVESRLNKSYFTIEINNYQLKMDYFQNFPFVTQKFNLFNFQFGLIKSHFIEVQNCITQTMLKIYNLENRITFNLADLNELISVKTSFFYYLPLIIAIGWLPNCLSIASEKMKERSSNLRCFYKICGLDLLTYHLSYTFYIFISLMLQTVLFIIILVIINLPYCYRIFTGQKQDKSDVQFKRELIDISVFLNLMIWYNLAISLHVQFFSLLYRTKKHFVISFTIFTFFTTILPFDMLSTHLQAPFQIFNDQAEHIMTSKFIIIYSTFLLCPNAALTYALRQIEDMSNIQNSWQKIDTVNLRTFESLSFHHITINDIQFIFMTYSILCSIIILNYELGFKAIIKLLFFDLFKFNLNRSYKMSIKNSGQKVRLNMVQFSSKNTDCNCSINNVDHISCVNMLNELNMYGKTNEIIVILSNKYKAKEYLFKSILGETNIVSGDLYLDKYNLKSFIKPSFLNFYPTCSVGVCFEEDIFDNHLSIEENLAIYSRLKSSQFLSNKSDIVLLLHLLKLKEVKRIPANLMNKNLKRKLAVAIALLGEQRILILNEPTKGTDLETSKLIWETLVKLKHDKLIIILTTNTKLNFHNYADQLYVLNNCKLFYIGSIHQLMNATYSGIQLIFKKLNSNYSLDQIEGILNEFFGDREFTLISSSKSRLIWYSFNINLISLCYDFRDSFNEQISDELNVKLEKIQISRMKLNLNSNYEKPQPVPYEQNPNIFFIGHTRVNRKKIKKSIDERNSNWFKDLVYCLKINLFVVQSILLDFVNLVLIFTIALYILNIYDFFNLFAFLNQSNQSNGSRIDKLNNLNALDFSSSAIMDNLVIYVIDSKRFNYTLPNFKTAFQTEDLVNFINRMLTEELNTHQFLCVWSFDTFKYVHEQHIDSFLIEKHLGGIMKLDYNTQLDALSINLIHNSHFPYLLLQIIDLFANFLIDHTNDAQILEKIISNSTISLLDEKPFKINLKFNENKALRFLYKNLFNRIANFFLLTCVLFFLSIFLNQNLILYINRRSTTIKHLNKFKQISSAVYWISNLISDQLTGMLSWIAILVILIFINNFFSPTENSFMEFLIVFYILYFFILTASFIFLFYTIYLSTNSLRSYLVLVAEICFLFGFAMPLVCSNLQFYIDEYYKIDKTWYSYFNIIVFLNQFISPIFNFVWTIDKLQSYHWDLKLCEKFDSSYIKHFCNQNMKDFNYVLNLPLCTDRIFKCCTSKELIYAHYLNDIFSTSFPLLLLNCILTGIFLISINSLDPIRILAKLKL